MSSVDGDQVIGGTPHKSKIGPTWHDLPERHGPRKTVDNRFWRHSGKTPSPCW